MILDAIRIDPHGGSLRGGRGARPPRARALAAGPGALPDARLLLSLACALAAAALLRAVLTAVLA